MSQLTTSSSLHMFRTFQQWKRGIELNRIRKNLRHKLQEYLSKQTFDSLRCFMQDKQVLNNIQTIHNRIELNVSPRTTLSALMIQHFPDIVMETKENQMVSCFEVQDKAKQLNGVFWGDERSFRFSWNFYKVVAEAFEESLKKWKADDMLQTLTPFFDMYHELRCFCNELEVSDVFVENPEHKVSAAMRIEKLEKEIQKMGGPAALQMMKQYHESRLILNQNETPEQRFEIHFRQQMKQAFWDRLKETLAGNDWTQIPSLISDLKQILLRLAPENTTQYNEYIDVEFIEQQIKSNTMTPDRIFRLIDYITDEITKLDIATREQASIANDKANQMWKDTIRAQFRKQMDLQLILVSFFKKAFQKLERIETLVELLHQTTES